MEKEHQEIQIGLKNGCFSIIDGTEIYQKEKIEPIIENAMHMRQKYLEGKLEKDSICEELLIDPSTHKGINYNIIGTQEFLDKYIKNLRTEIGYKIQCKCGKTFLCREDATWWLRKKFRYCGEDCGLKAEHERKLLASYKREKDSSYDLELIGTMHESLEILECIDDKYEKLYCYGSRRKYGDGIVKVYKIYKCRCYLCGKEFDFKSSDFAIKNDDYGINATKGYYSAAYCDCHKISSFQWRTINILKEYNVNYRVEVSFPELIGSKNLLRYDFAIFDTNGNIKFLMECQGKQHYEPVKEFGGKLQFKYQVENDKLKRDYAEKSNIPLVEIPYTCDTYEKELEFLKKHKVI